MLIPHNPSQHLHRATATGTVAPSELADVEVIEVPPSEETVAQPLASGRVARMNARPPL